MLQIDRMAKDRPLDGAACAGPRLTPGGSPVRGAGTPVPRGPAGQWDGTEVCRRLVVRQVRAVP
jgi:hypothetical protein